MNAKETAAYYDAGHRGRSAGYLRFALMAFVCFWQYGFPEPTGILSGVSGFATPAFFLLSGYFVLAGDRETHLKKTGRKIRRSALCFAALFVFYLAINILFCLFKHVSVSITKRTVFNFLVLNLWPLPIGSNIWFVQALLYAYLLLYAADRLGLMKFYKPVMILSFIIMLITGEFAGLVHFDVLGYQYIPGNWLTRALPYLLLGKFIREKSASLFKIKKWIFPVLFIVGGGMAVGEILLLSNLGCLVYQGHMIGYGIMAVSICCLVLSKPRVKRSIITRYDTALSGLIYIFLDPAYYAVYLIFEHINQGVTLFFGGLIALVLSAALAFLLRKTALAKTFFTVY